MCLRSELAWIAHHTTLTCSKSQAKGKPFGERSKRTMQKKSLKVSETWQEVEYWALPVRGHFSNQHGTVGIEESEVKRTTLKKKKGSSTKKSMALSFDQEVLILRNYFDIYCLAQ